MNIPTKHGFGKVLPSLMTAGVAVVAVLAAMSSSAGIQGSGFRSLLAVGTVTEPVKGNSDSIVVGGIPYSTSGAVIKVNGHAAAQGQINKGDVVSLTATESSDGSPAAATQVAFNGNIQGKIAGVDAPSATLFLLGQTVHVTSQTQFSANIKSASVGGLQGGDVVEVSGFADSVGDLIATRIEARGQSSVSRVVGSVRTLDPTRHTFYLNSLKVDYGNAGVDAALADGAPVTVEGVRFASDGTLLANVVHSAAAAIGQAGSIGRIQGLITSYPSSSYFEVDGLPIAVGAQTKLNLPVPIGLDVEVNITGTFDTNGVLVADSVQTSK